MTMERTSRCHSSTDLARNPPAVSVQRWLKDGSGSGWQVRLLCVHAFWRALAEKTAPSAEREDHEISPFGRFSVFFTASLWSFYYFWCAACDPLVGIAIDMLKARGVEATSLLLCITPFWAYVSVCACHCARRQEHLPFARNL